MEAQIVLALGTAREWCCLCYNLDEENLFPLFKEKVSNIAEDGIPWNSKDVDIS